MRLSLAEMDAECLVWFLGHPSSDEGTIRVWVPVAEPETAVSKANALPPVYGSSLMLILTGQLRSALWRRCFAK